MRITVYAQKVSVYLAREFNPPIILLYLDLCAFSCVLYNNRVVQYGCRYFARGRTGTFGAPPQTGSLACGRERIKEERYVASKWSCVLLCIMYWGEGGLHKLNAGN